ncbi:hypothetical protein ElyMa_000449200 [Elysia marginata]|uniref:Apple domain-containing protein n=1 Tax=Elysia marginata TaxID=1093978 RepID=A0AAV4FSJ6_9GAST|nr:hypothetical protein ElyMa_000449200 [Elysia marginata]
MTIHQCTTYSSLRRTQAALTFLLLCVLAWLCPSSANCSLNPVTWPSQQGIQTGAVCFDQIGGVASCTAACSSRQACKLVFLKSCGGADGQCTCTLSTTDHCRLFSNEFSVLPQNSSHCHEYEDRYELYFDRVMFKQFPHRLPINTISEFLVGGAEIISFSR